MEEISKYIKRLVDYAERNRLLCAEDKTYALNLLLSLFDIDEFDADVESFETDVQRDQDEVIDEILEGLCNIALERGIIESDSVLCRDLFDTKIMGIITPRPSEVIAKFRSLAGSSTREATDYFYSLCCASNYIRVGRIKKDIRWSVPSEYGEIDISINLSKPEKDPKAIAAAKFRSQIGYPKCLLCRENEGYAGRLNHPARQNLRLIPLQLGGRNWFFQYSPYVYYNEHCIVIGEKHIPMAINRSTFINLLDFVEYLPHYFVGSNSELPIVGGSILSHEHMQGGRYTFAMERAETEKKYFIPDFEDVEVFRVKWPMSVLRLCSDNKDRLVALADKILLAWRKYSDETFFIFAETDGEPHNTITPIARRRGDKFELDLVLRNNITTEEHPFGVFHPHKELHNIKKENIGLIEVMGLAVLPARLKEEMEAIEASLLSGDGVFSKKFPKVHKEWVCGFIDSYHIDRETIPYILRTEIGKAFIRVLEDAGVYKRNEKGMAAFDRFVESIN